MFGCEHHWVIYPKLMICKACGTGRSVETVKCPLLNEERLDELRP